MRQPMSASGEYVGEGTSHLQTPTVFSARSADLSWGVPGGDVNALPAERGSLFFQRPFKLSILMAVYNEEKTIVRAVEEVLTADCPCEIELIIVDDGSSDRTQMLLSQLDDPRVILHRLPANEGKGAALLAAASLASGTHVLPFDADLEYVADDIPRLLVPVLKGRCEVVYGVRLFGCNTVYRTYIYAVGNRILTRMANVLFNAHLSDLHTCLKMMPLTMLRSLDLHEKGFGLDSEITAMLLKRGVRPFEVPVSYFSRSHAEGKKITWRDALACARILFRVRLRDRSGREDVVDPHEEVGCSGVTVADHDQQMLGRVPTSATATNSSQA